jgi:hypothetical protein
VGVDFANTLLETYENGLVWSVPLHNGLRNVTFLIDWDVGTQIRQPGLQQFYLSQLPLVPYLSSFLTTARLAQPIRAFDATWYTASMFAGDRFLLVGDAGLFVDPLSSEGVHKAMASAIVGATIVNTILNRPSMRSHALSFYEESQRLTYAMHYQQSARYYREESRWQDRLFWQKRSGGQLKALGPGELGTPSSHAEARSRQQVSSVSIASGVAIELRPVIEGSFVELREAVVSPCYPRGVRLLQDVHVPALLRIVQEHAAVGDIIATYKQSPYGSRCTPESVRQVLARLVYEGVLQAIR